MNIIENNELYRTSGRTTLFGDTLYLGFSGSFVEFITNSKKISVEFATDKEVLEDIFLGRVAIYLNNVCMADVMLKEDGIGLVIENEYATSKDAQDGNVIRIEKLSEDAFGLVGIRKIEIDEGSNICKTVPSDKRIEFIGDSITCGYGVQASDELVTFKTSEENAEMAYAIKAARALGAEYSLVSWSGTGTLSNWVPPEVNEPLNEMLMPYLYRFQDFILAQRVTDFPQLYDANKYNPQLVCIFLGTNDDSYVRQIPDREKEFAATYYPFIEQVHAANPNSAILCMLGTMGRNLCAVEEECVKRFASEHPDVKIDFLWLPEQKPEIDGYGADFHPSPSTQEQLAQIVTNRIKTYMNW